MSLVFFHRIICMLKNKLINLILVYNTQNMWYILTIIYLYILLSEYLKLNLYKTSLFIYHLYLDIFSFFSFRVSKGLVV
ncbi:hypothetical protein C4E25_15755 [Clostridioides difficile]|nr:hypothetical protein C4E42_08865 [Clostridioides difficile]AVD40618.1 hypothetical protein C4E26_15745 [Clostridioides difficile]AVD44130.1 hypothetical protein C4E25_15755 [Clostridioides difficile]EGT3683433.1 hypothetical protein [Clostridioides difficile]EGT3722108.1 hypothetical protein [Clostridioides difficile]